MAELLQPANIVKTLRVTVSEKLCIEETAFTQPSNKVKKHPLKLHQKSTVEVMTDR